MSSNETRTESPAAETTVFDPDQTRETAHISQRWESTDSLVVQIIETVADVTHQEPDDMEPLHSVLDADALGSLLDGTRDSSVRVTFFYEGCEIIATSDGEVAVQPLTP